MKPMHTDDVEAIIVVGRHWDNTGLRDRLADEVEVADQRSIIAELRAAMEEREKTESVIDLRDGKRRRRARRRKSKP